MSCVCVCVLGGGGGGGADISLSECLTLSNKLLSNDYEGRVL